MDRTQGMIGHLSNIQKNDASTLYLGDKKIPNVIMGIVIPCLDFHTMLVLRSVNRLLSRSVVSTWARFTQYRPVRLKEYRQLKKIEDHFSVKVFPSLTICNFLIKDTDLPNQPFPTLAQLVEEMPLLKTLQLGSKKITNEGCVHLSKLFSLEILMFSPYCPHVTDLTALKYLTGLENLKFPPKIQDGALRDLTMLTVLKSLDCLSCDEITEAGLSVLSSMNILESLKLPKEVTDAALMSLKALISLKELLLFSCVVTDNGLSQLTSLTALQQLNISGVFTDIGLSYFSKLPSLSTVHVSFNGHITGVSLPTFSALRNLTLSSCPQVDLSYFSKMNTLTSLYLNYCQVMADSRMSVLSNMTGLQCLDLLSSKEINQRNVSPAIFLGEEVKFSKGTQITSMGLFGLRGLNPFVELSLVNLTDEGCLSLSTMTTLKKLEVESSLVTDKGLLCLNSLMAMEYLKLTCPQVSDVGLLVLRNMSHLTSLQLEDCQNVTGNVFSNLIPLVYLKKIEIGCCPIDDGGLFHLIHLRGLKDLKLYECQKITDEGYSLVKEMNPRIKLKWYRS